MTSNQAHAEANRTRAAAVSFFRHMVVLGGALGESRIFTYATPSYFLRGFESGINDGGLFVGPCTLPGETTTDRFFALQHDHEDKPVVVPFDIKYGHPTNDQRGNVTWSFGISPDQWDTAQAIIVGSFKEPDYVAMIPMHYIHQRFGHHRPGGIFDYCRPLWTLHPLQPFPREMGPFMVPSARLAQTIEGMHQFAKGTTTEWINEHTGVPFKTPNLLRSDPSKLEPSQRGKRSAQAIVKQIYAAFRKYSTAYRVELNELFPFNGDFKLVDLLHGTETFVEAKLDQCEWLLEAGGTSNYMRYRNITYSEGGEQRITFTWKAQWDYLYTIKGNHALFIPRDVVPAAFWLDRTSLWLSWPADGLDSLYGCILDRSLAPGMVENIERILHTFGNARNTIPILPYYEEPLKELMFDSPFDQSARQLALPENIVPQYPKPWSDGWNSKGYRRGFGSHLHLRLRGNTYESWAMEAMWELCRRRLNGLVQDLGRRNSMCRMYIAKYRWNKNDTSRYDCYGEQPQGGGRAVHRRTPLVRVSFIRFRWPHDSDPSSNKSTAYMLKLLAQRKPSLVICDMFSYRSIRLPHARYVVPSTQLPSSIKSPYVKIQLKNGTWDSHRVDDDQIIDTVTSVVDGRSQVWIGDSLVNCRDYYCYQEDALKHGVDEWAKTVDNDDDDDGDDDKDKDKDESPGRGRKTARVK